MKIVKLYNVPIVLLLAMLLLACNNSKTKDHNYLAGQQLLYTCPMHPEIVKDTPGSCPLCGMDLVRQEKINSHPDIELESLLRSPNEFVISSIPLTTMVERKEDIQLDLLGQVAYDTKEIGTISSRVVARITRLYV